jgi:hypothetical protein
MSFRFCSGPVLILVFVLLCCFTYLNFNGCDGDASVCSNAAPNGHLGVLQPCVFAARLGGAAVGAEQWLSLRCGCLCSVCSEIWPFSRGRIVFIGCWKEVVVLLCKIHFPTSGFPTLSTFSNVFFFLPRAVIACIIWAGSSFLDFIFFHFDCVAFV